MAMDTIKPDVPGGKTAELAHFLYGKGFWYGDPIREMRDLADDDLYWVPDNTALPIIWHAGHVAHRERFHIGRFLQGIKGEIIPPRYEIFGPDWASVAEIYNLAGPVPEIMDWIRDVREKSMDYISSLSEDDFHSVPETSEFQFSVAHWLFITTVHAGVHIGRMQMLRAMLEGKPDRPC